MTETKDLIIITASCVKNLELSKKFLNGSTYIIRSLKLLFSLKVFNLIDCGR